MTFRKINQFATDNPRELARQLVELERNIEQAFADAKAETYPRGKVYEVRSGETVVALIGGYYKCDTATANIVLMLETPRPEHRNSFLIVEKTHASNSVRLQPLDSTINGSPTYVSLSSANAYDIFCNGEGYRREF